MTPAQRSRFVFAMVTLLALAALAAAAHWRYPVDRAALPERSTGYRINVNSAEQDELCLLPRVGPSLANYIIERRQTVGPFTAVDQLDQVRDQPLDPGAARAAAARHARVQLRQAAEDLGLG